MQSTDGKAHAQGDKVGAMQSFESGRTSDISCACHWTVNVAASKGHGKLYGDAYSVSPCGVFVPADSKIKTPEDLAGVPISVGYQSGSHYATIQALEQYMPLDQINLSYKEGMLFSRMDLLFEGKIPACTLFSGPYYFAEQLGFRKVIDCTFMMATMITGDPDPEDVRKFFRALKRAQRDIDLRPELYTRFYKNEFPKRFHDKMDTRRWGPGERIVFEPYSKEVFEESRDWIRERGIFEGNDLGAKAYKEAVVTFGGLRFVSLAPRSGVGDALQSREPGPFLVEAVTQPVAGRRPHAARAGQRSPSTLNPISRSSVAASLSSSREGARCTITPRSITSASCVSDSTDLGVLLDQDHRRPLLRDHALNRGGQLLDDDRREALERLVEQQQRRVGHQRARDRQHLLLAAGQLVAHVGAPLGEAREQAVDRLEVPAARGATPRSGFPPR